VKLLRAARVAEILDTSTARVYELIRLGILPAVKLGRQVRVAEDVLQAWIAAGGQDLPGGWKWRDDEDPAQVLDEVPF
jgi:excisionase family DNA binding protein